MNCDYFGILGNPRAVNRFACEARCPWKKGLGRRSHRARMTWEKFNQMPRRYPLPPARMMRKGWQLRLVNL